MPLPIQKRVECIAASPCMGTCTPQGTPDNVKGIPCRIGSGYDMGTPEL